MSTLKYLNNALDYIESNLTGEIDLAKAAQLAHCSEYHFSRMFSYLAGITLWDNIRRRRLTLATFFRRTIFMGKYRNKGTLYSGPRRRGCSQH